MLAWHFLPNDGRLRYGEHTKVIVGEPLRVQLPLIMCQHGLHASKHPFDALTYAPGLVLCRVELEGEILRGADKVCAEIRTVIWQRYMHEEVCEFADWCAARAEKYAAAWASRDARDASAAWVARAANAASAAWASRDARGASASRGANAASAVAWAANASRAANAAWAFRDVRGASAASAVAWAAELKAQRRKFSTICNGLAP